MIHLISTFDQDRHYLIPQFIRHYRSMGIDKFHITLHTDISLAEKDKKEILKKGVALLREEQIYESKHLDCKFSSKETRKNHNNIQESIAENDWIVWADLDEFQEYWENDLHKITEQLEKKRINTVRGRFLDRVSFDGSLKKFDPQVSIFRQFPNGCDFTKRVLRGSNTKVTLARAPIRLTRGNHNPRRNQHLSFSFRNSLIHHFKWDKSVVSRLKERVSENWKSNFHWWVESDRFYQHIGEHGKINLNDIPVVNPTQYADSYFKKSNTLIRRLLLKKC